MRDGVLERLMTRLKLTGATGHTSRIHVSLVLTTDEHIFTEPILLLLHPKENPCARFFAF